MQHVIERNVCDRYHNCDVNERICNMSLSGMQMCIEQVSIRGELDTFALRNDCFINELPLATLGHALEFPILGHGRLAAMAPPLPVLPVSCPGRRA